MGVPPVKGVGRKRGTGKRRRTTTREGCAPLCPGGIVRPTRGVAQVTAVRICEPKQPVREISFGPENSLLYQRIPSGYIYYPVTIALPKKGTTKILQYKKGLGQSGNRKVITCHGKGSNQSEDPMGSAVVAWAGTVPGRVAAHHPTGLPSVLGHHNCCVKQNFVFELLRNIHVNVGLSLNRHLTELVMYF